MRVERQQFLHLPHASGAAPTITVEVVITPRTITSIRAKSAIIASKNDHPQGLNKDGLMEPEIENASAIQITKSDTYNQ